MDNKKNYSMKEEKCGAPEIDKSTNQAAGSCDPKCSGSKKKRDKSRSRGRSRSRSRKMSLFQTICSQSKNKKKKKKRRRSGHSRVKKCKPGIKTRNPFFNFLRIYRRNHCGLTAVQIAVQGAQEWNRMKDQQKLPYVRIACKAKPFKRKKGGRSRSHSRSRSRKR